MSTEQRSVESIWQREQQMHDAEVQEFVTRRALIEQAKGMLMLVYGVDEDAAFDMLRVHSQNYNVKLRLLAEQIVKDLIVLARPKGPARQVALDGLLAEAHRRIANSAPRQLDGENKIGVPMKELGNSAVNE